MIECEVLAIDQSKAYVLLQARDSILQKIQSMSATDLKAMDDDDESGSYLLTMQDNIAVIDINGALTGRYSFWNKYFGVVSYQEIKEAIVEAVDKKAASILFAINSPGGDVSGMADVANFMSSLEMPTISFTAGSMASAAYFFGSQADHVYADAYADVGSIGVYVKLYDQSEYMKKMGLKAERFRSGDLKATGDRDFKLTDKERAYIQGKVDTYASMFYQTVSDARGMSLEMLNKLDITSGRTFIGKEAKDVGLVDKIMSFEQSMLKAYELAAKYVDKKKATGLSYRQS